MEIVSHDEKRLTMQLDDQVRTLRRLAWMRAAEAVACRLASLARLAKANFNPSQPRVPAGQPHGGRWTRLLGAATQSQKARLHVAARRAKEAIDRVRELDPRWRPTPSAYETVEGAIRAREAEVREAEARLAELARVGIGPGPFARESIPARGLGRDFYVSEHASIDRIGLRFGCHTCGSLDPGTRSGSYVIDHQPPSALNVAGRQQRLYPQCVTCMHRQGGWIRGRGSRK